MGTEENPVLVDNPLYNIGNKPFNSQAILANGEIVAISAKSIQPDGPAEYEPRQFQSWPDYLGSTEITLATGDTVPFGKVFVEAKGKDGAAVTIYHEICAEAWPGIDDYGQVNQKEQEQGRYLNRLVKDNDISLVINPSASKPEPHFEKSKTRAVLCETGSELCNGGYVYTNCMGLEAAPVAFEGGSIFAEKGEIIHKSARYQFAEVSYSSAVMELPIPEKGHAHATFEHQFQTHEKGVTTGAAEDLEDLPARRMEETVRNTAIWLRDYLQKSGAQGFFVSLSGGADSAFGAVMLSQMVDLNIHELEAIHGNKKDAVDAFVNQFPSLKYHDEILAINASDGPETAIKSFKAQFFTCAYMGTDNSSEETLNAARTLIEGSTLPDGRKVEGIGGTFHQINVQDIVDSYMEAFAGIVRKDVPPELRNQLREEIKEYVKGTRTELSDEVQAQINGELLSWANKEDDITLQNIQARARLPVAWLFGNNENKIACVTSNWSEAVAGYWTFGGDGHMGSINLCGGVPKTLLRETLAWLENEGIEGLNKVESLHLINNQKPSAELRQLQNGKIAQYDEDDMMPYTNLDLIAEKMIIGKKSPPQVFQELKNDEIFGGKEELVNKIDKVCRMWHGSQFKRYASVVTPFLGENVDPHGSQRTTIIGDGFETGRAHLKLEYLLDKAGGDKEAFRETYGNTLDKLKLHSKISKPVRDIIIKTDISTLENTLKDIDLRPNLAKHF